MKKLCRTKLNGKAIIATILALTLGIVSVPLCESHADEGFVVTDAAVNTVSNNVSNPRIEEAYAAGQVVTWDRISFGSYPRSEVSAGAVVYEQLVNATHWNENGDATIDGVKYRRLNKSQAVSGKGFPWEDDETYHYFRYEPITWRVIKTDGETATLLSDEIIDNQMFNVTYEFMSWDKSTLRSWLNGYGPDENKNKKDYTNTNFIDSAFSKEEQAVITDTAVRNDDNYVYDSVEDATTYDKIYLLSASESYGAVATGAGFVADENICDEARRCPATDYANAMGTTSTEGGFYDGNCIWWLRTPGKERFGMYVEPSGKVNKEGYVVNSKNYGVRVALRVELDDVDHFLYQGKINSNGEIIAPPPIAWMTLKNPVIEDTGKPMTSQQLVTWDNIYYGSYPQTEVVSGDAVYVRLVHATNWDENHEITIDGVKYRRMKRSDATFSKSYRNFETFLENPDGYYWEDSETYHYFKYEPIRWRVLTTASGQALLLSDCVLDTQNYNETNTAITWKWSAIRSWLNGYDTSVSGARADYSQDNFIDSAFTEDEQSAIHDTFLTNQDNIKFGTEAGGYTEDKIFLLSEDMVCTKQAENFGFLALDSIWDEARRCKSSDYAKAMGVYSSTDKQFAGNCGWLLSR